MNIIAPLTTNDLAITEAMNLGLMTDTAVRLVRTVIRDADDQEKEEDWLPENSPDTSPCLYQPEGTRESGTNVVTDTDRVWVPYGFGARLTRRDRLAITTHTGVTLQRSIDGDPQVEPQGVLVSLKGSST